jgi:hypothetical protein
LRNRILIAVSVVLVAVVATLSIPTEALANTSCTNWTNSFSKGSAYGRSCYDTESGLSTVRGWVTDTRSDGYCVFSRSHDGNLGRTSDSPWACPKGKTVEFTITFGFPWNNQSIESIYVG